MWSLFKLCLTNFVKLVQGKAGSFRTAIENYVRNNWWSQWCFKTRTTVECSSYCTNLHHFTVYSMQNTFHLNHKKCNSSKNSMKKIYKIEWKCVKHWYRCYKTTLLKTIYFFLMKQVFICMKWLTSTRSSVDLKAIHI